jgi:hypothetical protein
MLHGYTYSDLMGSTVDWKSPSGYCFSLGSTMFSWSSRKQGYIAQSAVEAENLAASDVSIEAAWLKKPLSDLFSLEFEPTVIHYDKQSCVNLSVILVFL